MERVQRDQAVHGERQYGEAFLPAINEMTGRGPRRDRLRDTALRRRWLHGTIIPKVAGHNIRGSGGINTIIHP